ncbi:MAG: hypothetical protein L3J20_12620 [Flavobacteriaceae bacterium]|nr:hypothetical protein [Flavobacteriaceae bacterium]
MKNLEKFNVKELNSSEFATINGGWLLRIIAGAALWHWDNWDDIKEGFASAQE